jgi:hypothetical protein
MLLAVDDRVKAATIMGFTCDYREVLFPHVAAHTCLHFPGAVTIANMPEVSALAMPVPVQYLVMDDYTKNFRDNSFPAIKELYRKNGFADRLDCQYWPTEHVYDKPKRQATYAWMQRWLNNGASTVEDSFESQTTTFPIPRLLELDTHLPAESRDLAKLTPLFFAAHKPAFPAITTREHWISLRNQTTGDLKQILGMNRQVPVRAAAAEPDKRKTSDVSVETFELYVEGIFRIPVTILTPPSRGPLKPLLLFTGQGVKNLLAETGPGSAIDIARSGRMVVVADLRFFGDVSLDNLIGVGPTSLLSFKPAYAQDEWLCNQDRSFRYHIRRAWDRNSIIWGRPLVGMMVTDIKAIVSHLHQRPGVDLSDIEIVGRSTAEDADYSVPLAVLFAAALDSRIKRIDVDLGGRSFEQRSLPAIPFVLWHGDVLQWAACTADRPLTLRNAPAKTDGLIWLKNVFAVASSEDNLRLINKP